MKIAVRDAAIVSVACTVVSLPINALRKEGIPLVQKAEYEILVPCPETGGAVDPLAPSDPVLRERTTMMIDSRSTEAFSQWHFRGALGIPYDYLEPTTPELVRKVATSGAQRVVVYGDGLDPDSGEQLGKELSGKGIRNVAFVVGGAEALKRAIEGGVP